MDGVTGACRESKNEEMLKFFIQLMTMNKHMIDDILPDLLLLVEKPVVETIIHHCNEFDDSFRVFKKLCSIISRKNLNLVSQPVMTHPFSKDRNEFTSENNVCLNPPDSHTRSNDNLDLSTSSDGDAEVQCGDDDVWKLLIAEATKNFNSDFKFGDFYYCGLCNVRCFGKHIWDSHTKGKRHVSRCNLVINHNMACETCGLNILSDDQHISMIMGSPEHRLYDETIVRAKRAGKLNEPNQEKSHELSPEAKTAKLNPKSDSQITGKASQITGINESPSKTNAFLNPPNNHGSNGNLDLRTSSDGGSEVQCDDDVWKLLIAEATKKFNADFKLTDMYYCGLCNVRSVVKHIWDSHTKGKRHVSRCNLVLNHNMACETCGLNILSDDQHISMIIGSPEHRLFDETIVRAKRAGKLNEPNQEKSHELSPEAKTSKLNPKSDSQITGKASQITGINESPSKTNAFLNPPNNHGSNGNLDLRTSSDGGSEVQCDDDVWKLLIAEATKKFNADFKLTDMYYCGLCNVRCVVKHIWDSHTKGKRHVSRCNVLTDHNMACETCGLNILSDDHHISLMIMGSPEHRLYDETIFRAKRAGKLNEPNQEKSHELSPEAKTSKLNPKSDSQITGKTSEVNGEASHSTAKASEITEKGRQITGDAVFKNKTICSNFAVLTEKIRQRIENRKNYTACYCRPCDVTSKSKEAWTKHIVSEKHVSLMKSKKFENVLCGCRQCDFGIVASKVIALCYMCYHIEQCHDQSTDDIVHEEYMEIKQITPKIWGNGKYRSEGSSKQSSIKGSTDSLNLSRRGSLNDGHLAQPLKPVNKDLHSGNYENCENSSSSKTVAARSMEEYVESLHDLSRTSSRGSCRESPQPVERSEGFKESPFVKYIQDVCAPLKGENDFNTNDDGFKRPKPPTKSSSMGGNNYVQCSGRNTPISGRSTPSRPASANLGHAREHQQSANALEGSQKSGNRFNDVSSINSTSRVQQPSDFMDVSYEDDRSDTATFGFFKRSNSSPVNGDNQPEKNSRVPQKSPKFLVSDTNDLVAPFIVMLRHKEMKYQENPWYKPFSALCMLCPNKSFLDRFDWTGHISTHSPSDIEKEVTCSDCNSYLYGKVSEINTLLIPHEEHIRIDKILTS